MLLDPRTGLQTTAGGPPLIFVAQLVLGFGAGLTGTPALNAALSGVAREDTGVTAAMSSTSNQIGASIGTALLSTIAASVTESHLASHGASAGATAAIVHGFTTATAWAAIVLLAGTLVVGLLLTVDQRHGPSGPASAPLDGQPNQNSRSASDTPGSRMA